MADELSVAKGKLSKVLGKAFTNYCSLLKKWFSGKLTKDDFDMEARLLFTIQTIHYHNDFLAALLNKCNIQLENDQKSTSSLTGLKALKRLRRSASTAANINPEKALSNSSVQKVLPNALPALTSAHINNIQPSVSCSEDGVLPDSSMIHGRLFIICWENGLECLDFDALSLILHALRDVLKDLIHACIEKKRSYLTYDDKFQHLFGVDDAKTESPEINHLRPHVAGKKGYGVAWEKYYPYRQPDGESWRSRAGEEKVVVSRAGEEKVVIEEYAA
uniref:Transcriptional adapter 1 n=1 Tax=Romanomermis culicivorax TaxID=13658 RepID=A0A915L5F5_ROMCU